MEPEELFREWLAEKGLDADDLTADELDELREQFQEELDEPADEMDEQPLARCIALPRRLVRLSAASPDGTEQRPATIEVLAYCGGVVAVDGWGPLAFDLAGLELPDSVTLLADHRAELDGVIGAGKATVQGSNLVLTGTLAMGSEAAQKVVSLSRAGVRLEASVGVESLETEHVFAGETAVVNNQTLDGGGRAFSVIRRGLLREISILPMGADSQTAVSISARRKGNRTMANPATPSESLSDKVLARWNESSLSDGVRRHLEPVMVRAAAGKLRYAAFENELLRAERDDAELRALKASRPQGPDGRRPVHTAAADVIEAAMSLHLSNDATTCRIYGAETAERARGMKLRSMVDVARASLMADRQELPAGGSAELIRAAFSTSNLPRVLGNLQSKLLLDQFQRLPLASRVLSKKLSANDFKVTAAARLAARGVAFEPLADGGEIKHGRLEDSGAEFQLATFAKMYSVTRQQLVSDDLAALAEMPAIVARGAGLAIESLFWTLVLSNANSFVSEAHGNTMSAALGLTGLAEGVKLIRQMVDADGQPILSEPKFLVCPPELEMVARSLFISASLVSSGGDDLVLSPSASIYAGAFEPVISPYMSNARFAGSSTSAWYLFGDPSAVPAFGLCFLDGNESPVVEQADADFSTLGVQFRGYVDAAVCQLDHQGVVRSSGAG